MAADLELFVRESLARGLPRAAIREKLLAAGWRPEEVAAALDAFADLDFPVPVPRRKPYLSAREAFLYLVLFVTLYTMAFNVGGLLFQFVDRWIPDRLERGSPESQLEAVRNGTAAVLIAFPIFLFLSRTIGRALEREPEKRGSKVRKWLTYLTLFIAALVLIGNLTVLVRGLLGGELTPRFLLKTLAVFAIAGTVFGHYLAGLRREERETGAPARQATLPARAAAVVVGAVALGGLLFSGSPREERRQQFDSRRIEDLRAIAGAIDEHFRAHGRLPDSLGVLLQDPNTMLTELEDPESGRRFEYRVSDSTHYELCATFAEADSQVAGPRGRPYGASPFWRHPAGRTCFPLVVSKR